MTGEIKNLPASVHGRLRNKARERGRPFQEILQYFANERFLYRLAQSKHADMFVLVIEELKAFLVPVIRAISEGIQFDLYWDAGEKWHE